MEPLYPIFLKLAGSSVLIVGGGTLALHKLTTLRETGAVVTLVAPQPRAALREAAREMGATLLKRPFRRADLRGRALVFAATDDPRVNRRVFLLAQRRGVLANAVDDPENCRFFTPSVVRRAGFTLALSSEGRFPGATKALREVLQAWFPEPHTGLLQGLFAFRQALLASPRSAAERGAALRGLLEKFRSAYLLPAPGPEQQFDQEWGEEAGAGADGRPKARKTTQIDPAAGVFPPKAATTHRSITA